MLKAFSALSLFVLVSFYGLSAEALCKSALESASSKPAQVRQYKTIAFNVENLFMRVGAHERTTGNNVRRISKGGRDRSMIKDPEDIARISRMLLEESADFMILTEVEDGSADRFNKEYLNNEYDVFCVRGNDPRGIEIALLVKKTLKLVYEHRSHKHLTWKDPLTRQDLPIFSRDLPVLILREALDKEPILVMAGNHAKSKRDRVGDKESHLWRSKQYETAGQIFAGLEKEFPRTPLIFGGDFNTEVRKGKLASSDRELSPIRKITQDAFEIADESVSIERSFHSLLLSRQ